LQCCQLSLMWKLWSDIPCVYSLLILVLLFALVLVLEAMEVLVLVLTTKSYFHQWLSSALHCSLRDVYQRVEASIDSVLLMLTAASWQFKAQSTAACLAVTRPSTRLVPLLLLYYYFTLSYCVNCVQKSVNQGSHKSGKTGNSQGIWVVRERSGKSILFLKKVRENEKLLPPDVRFSG